MQSGLLPLCWKVQLRHSSVSKSSRRTLWGELDDALQKWEGRECSLWEAEEFGVSLQRRWEPWGAQDSYLTLGIQIAETQLLCKSEKSGTGIIRRHMSAAWEKETELGNSSPYP